MDLNRKKKVALTVCFILGFLATPQILGVFLSSHQSNTTGNVTLQSNSGPNVTVTSGRSIDLSEPFPNDTAIDLDTSDGNVTFISSDRTNFYLTDVTGPWTNITRFDNPNGVPLTISPADKRFLQLAPNDIFGIGGGGQLAERCKGRCVLKYRDINTTDDGIDIVYDRPYDLGWAVETGYTGSQNVKIVDVDNKTILNSETRGGVYGLPNGSHRVAIVEQQGAPVLSNPTPEGPQQTPPANISINVSDPNFDPGENVTLEWSVDGTKTNTTSTTSGGKQTITAPKAAQTPGPHTIKVTATDSYGATESDSFSYKNPDDIIIRNETKPSQIITDAVNLTFYGEDQVYNRSTTTGLANLTNLPDQDYFVDVRSDGYFKRTIYLPSLFVGRDIYLLNKSVSTIQSRFVLDDPTGQFDSNSILRVKKPITRNGTTTFREVYGDAFGSEGVTIDLQSDTRYRLVLRTVDGTVQEVGPYRSDVGETVQVQPGSPTVNVGDISETWGTDAQILQNSTGAWKLQFQYSDDENITDSLTVSVYERGNESNTLGVDRNFVDLGTATGQYNMTVNESKKTWVVEYDADRGSDSFTATETVARQNDLTGNFSAIWKAVIGIGILLISAGLFSALNAGVGGVVVAVEAGVLWWTGWLTGTTTGAGIVIALFIAIVVQLYQRR
jgi:hypothetical protein